jgi:hypothetical protein
MAWWDIEWERKWPETISLLLLIVGFLVSALLTSVFLSYLTIFLSGFFAGRVYYDKKHSDPIFPFVLMIVAFIVGYWAGAIFVNRFWVLIFFSIGFGISYYLHLKKILVIFKSENFVK